MKAPCGVEIEIGQRWQEVDPRFVRIVHIVGLDLSGFKDVGAVQIQDVKHAGTTKRMTWARLDRFNGKRGGYKLEED